MLPMDGRLLGSPIHQATHESGAALPACSVHGSFRGVVTFLAVPREKNCRTGYMRGRIAFDDALRYLTILDSCTLTPLTLRCSRYHVIKVSYLVSHGAKRWKTDPHVLRQNQNTRLGMQVAIGTSRQRMQEHKADGTRTARQYEASNIFNGNKRSTEKSGAKQLAKIGCVRLTKTSSSKFTRNTQ